MIRNASVSTHPTVVGRNLQYIADIPLINLLVKRYLMVQYILQFLKLIKLKYFHIHLQYLFGSHDTVDRMERTSKPITRHKVTY